MLDIRQIRALSDNYVYLINDAEAGACAVVDPSEDRPVLDELDRLGWTPTHILCTHHHPDHVGGVPGIKKATGCTVVGAAADAHRIPDLDVQVAEGDTVTLGGSTARVFEIPGHTSGHVAYWFADDAALFCGDTLFSLGCGRLFEGTPGQMWTSLSKLRELPDTARVFCGHEYTQANATFSLTVEPDNAALKARVEEVERLREAGHPTVPTPLGDEKKANPFLRADVPALQKAIGMAGADPVDVFAEVRRRKDSF